MERDRASMPAEVRSKRRWAYAVLATCVAAAAALLYRGMDTGSDPPPVLRARLVQAFPHDASAFTQGLVWHQGRLFESTGNYGESDAREVELESGRVIQKVELDPGYFGEGLVVFGDQLIQLTWQSRLAIRRQLEDLSEISEHRFPGEGWGITTDGEVLIVSDGSPILKRVDPQTFEILSRIRVHAGRREVDELNELEFIDGRIYANIWHSTRIAIIDPADGRVESWIELADVVPEEVRGEREAVANGIAWIPDQRRLLVTGKNWPQLLEIELVADSDD